MTENAKLKLQKALDHVIIASSHMYRAITAHDPANPNYRFQAINRTLMAVALDLRSTITHEEEKSDE